MSRVHFVGAGRMGLPMVERLVADGHEVHVLARHDDARVAAEKTGATAVGGITAVGTDAELVVVCVFTDEQVRQVCLDDGVLGRMPKGSTLVVHTTISPRTVETLASAAEPFGVAVIDAAVSGGPHDIAAGA